VYQDGDEEKLIHYVKTHDQSNANVHFSQLAGASSLGLSSKYHRHTTKKVLISSLPMPECGFIKAMNTGEGFSSIGWRFSSKKVFNHRKLQAFLISLTAERIKAAFITELGTFGYNIATNDFTKKRLSDSKESRIEIISQHLDDSLEAQLIACIIY
jgi:hypothetical protein